jgi:hypothetical protein
VYVRCGVPIYLRVIDEFGVRVIAHVPSVQPITSHLNYYIHFKFSLKSKMTQGNSSKKWALLSLSDKTDLIPLAAGLHELGIHLLASGGTAKAIKQANLPVQ